MLWSIDKTGYPLTSITWPHHRFRNRPIEVVYFLMLSADRWLVVNWSQAQVNFLNFVWNMLCLCHYGSALLRFWCQTDLERKNLASYLKIQAGKTFFFHGHVLRPIFILWLVKIWQFVRKIYAGSWNLFTLTDEVFCQLLMFLTVFLHWMIYNDIQCRVNWKWLMMN